MNYQNFDKILPEGTVSENLKKIRDKTARAIKLK